MDDMRRFIRIEGGYIFKRVKDDIYRPLHTLSNVIKITDAQINVKINNTYRKIEKTNCIYEGVLVQHDILFDIQEERYRIVTMVYDKTINNVTIAEVILSDEDDSTSQLTVLDDKDYQIIPKELINTIRDNIHG